MQIDEIRIKQLQSDIQRNSALRNNGIRLAGNSSYISGASFEGVAADFGAKTIRRENPNYSKNELTEDFMNAIGNDEINSESDVSLKNKMLSTVKNIGADDIKNADESGIDLKKKEPYEITTVTDQIKEKFVKAGIDVSGMGGLSELKMEALSGGDASKLSQIKTAEAKASEIKDISLNDALYLVKNGQEPTIENVYRAEFSGTSKYEKLNDSADENKIMPSSDSSDYVNKDSISDINKQVADYKLSDDTNKVLDDIKDQLSQIFDAAGLYTSDSTSTKLAGIFLETDIPVTAENLKAFSDISNGTFKDTPEKILSSITDSINEGKAPEQAFMIDGLSNTEKAENAVKIINNADVDTVSRLVKAGKNLTISNLAIFENSIEPEAGEDNIMPTAGEKAVDHDRPGIPSSDIFSTGNTAVKYELSIVSYQRTISETQLLMTSSATLSLYKNGIDVDTTDLADLVDTLKERENELYKILLGDYSNENPPLSIENDAFNSENSASIDIYGKSTFSFEERIEIFESTNKNVSDFYDYPVSILGSRTFLSGRANITFSSLHDMGEKSKASYEKAGKEYETFGTEIRKDLGDSIKKAFRNVPEILKDLGIKDTEMSEQAVRILSYNNSEITKDSVLSMKETAEKVKRTLSNMKPGVVAEMVKEGINPLDLTIDELYEKTEEIKVNGTDSTEENFGKFLYEAEKSGDISDEEREGFIGIARLCYQVEKTDGAVIGQLLNQGTDITLRNMMTAVRSRRHEGKEYSVDDEFGGANTVNSENNITLQIEKAFQTMRMKDASKVMTVEKMKAFSGEENYLRLSPDEFAGRLENMETLKNHKKALGEEGHLNDASWENFDLDAETLKESEYFSSVKQDIISAAESESQVYSALHAFDMPETIENLASLNYLMTQRNELYRGLFGNNHSRNVFSETTDGADEKTISDVMEDLTNEFGEAVKTPESMAEAEEALYDLAEHALDDAIVDEKNGSVDIKAMRLKANTMKFAMKLGNEQETFALPIKIADQNGNLVLKIVRGRKEDRGAFKLSLFSEALGNVNASFKYSEGGIHGNVSAASENTKKLLESKADELNEKMAGISESSVSITYSWDESLDTNYVFRDNLSEYDFEIAPADEKEKNEIQTSRLYAMARAFIENIS